MAVNYLYLSAISTVVSFVGLQWWTFAYVDALKSDGLIDGNGISSENAGRALELLLGSNITVAFLVHFVFNAFLLVVLCLKTLFFVQLYPSETRKVLERIVNYVIHKATFLPLVVPPNTFQVGLWSTWLIVLCSLKMFQSLARDRLERLNASPMATPFKYFRVFSALLFVLSADFLWIRLCMMIYWHFRSSLFLLLFFEPLCIAFETLQAVMVHGFQLIDIWQRHSTDSSADSLGTQASYKSAAGSLSEWRGFLTRNYGFLLDIMTLFMAIGHYLIIWWLHGMAFHLVDAVLFLNLRALLSATVKKIRGYIKSRRALSSLDRALPDANYEELCAFNDECAICRGPMAKAKKLACNHLFHLGCLSSWLDQSLTDAYSCPTCRRPLLLSNSQNPTSSIPGQLSNDGQQTEQLNMGLEQQRIPGHLLPAGVSPNQQQNPSDMWRRVGFDTSWMSAWPNPGLDSAGTSSAIRSVGLTGVQMIMRQLESVSENYAHASLDDAAWNFWQAQNAPGPSLPPPPSSLMYNRNAPGLWFRNTLPPINRNVPEILGMAERVQEVLPHLPLELIIEDLMRTNNVNITVNNLLLVQ